jgi:hypothetical protein
VSTRIVIPTELRQSVDAGGFLLFVGAGLSRVAGAPGWEDLLEQLVDDAVAAGINLGDPPEAARRLAKGTVPERQVLAERLDRKLGARLHAALAAVLGPLPVTPLHERLAAQEWLGVITTNYDTLIEDAYLSVKRTPMDVMTWQDRADLASIHARQHWILKVHGTLASPDSVVLGQRSYDALEATPSAMDTLQTLFQQRTTLFIGYGLGDTDVLGRLRRVTEAFGRDQKTHFVFVSDDTSTIWTDHLTERFGIVPVYYEARGHDHATGLAAVFDDLFGPHGDDQRARILFVVTRPGQPAGTAPQLLVTDRVEAWGLPAKPGRRLDKAYLLPSIGGTGEDLSLAAATFAREAKVAPEAIALEPAAPFVDRKKDARTDRWVRFRFAPVAVRLVGSAPQLDANPVLIRDRPHVWKTLAELQAHPPTTRLTEGVLRALAERYGDELERLPTTLT